MAPRSTYTQEIGDKVCAELSKGRTLRDVCRDQGMPDQWTVLEWARIEERAPGFGSQYARAREIGYQVMADELIDLSDGADAHDSAGVNKARLQTDTRKWLLSKALPKIYGDKVQHDVEPIKHEHKIELVMVKPGTGSDVPVLTHNTPAISDT